jgi:hypothetical protein
MSRESETGFHAEVGDERASLQCLGFGAEFHRVGDRWTHTIFGCEPRVAWARSASVPSGSEDPARVGDPVYQELQLHENLPGSGVCLLLTGLSFNHHFSATVMLAPDPVQPGGIRLDFDVADRCRSNIASLAATYIVELDSGALADASPERIAWDTAEPSAGRLELVVVPPATLALAEAGRKATRVQILGSIQPDAFTHRLCYSWRWASIERFTL